MWAGTDDAGLPESTSEIVCVEPALAAPPGVIPLLLGGRTRLIGLRALLGSSLEVGVYLDIP
jgi:hypothetical protein